MYGCILVALMILGDKIKRIVYAPCRHGFTLAEFKSAVTEKFCGRKPICKCALCGKKVNVDDILRPTD
jgi:hypothetical protein